MRILNVTAQKPDSTGSGTYLAETVRCMDAAGHATAVVCGIGARDVVGSLPASTLVRPVRFDTEELPFHVCGMSDSMPYPSTRYRDLTPQMERAFTDAFARTIRRAAEEFAPDVVLCHHLYLAASVAREVLPDVPMGVVCHSTDLRQMAQHDLARERILAAMRRMDVVFALHEEQAAQIAETYGVDPGRIVVAGTGYNAQIFNTKGRARRTGGPLELAFVGKVSRYKGMESLLRALDALTLPQGVRLRVAGGHSDEDEYARIAAQASACRWPVELLGRLAPTEVARLYRASDVFVLPSFFEGLPLVSIEAAACGCRVVMTDLPGIRPWMEKNAQGADVTWVAPPRMRRVDEPLPEDLPAFEERLAEAIGHAAGLSERPADVTSLAWEGLTARLTDALGRAGQSRTNSAFSS